MQRKKAVGGKMEEYLESMKKRIVGTKSNTTDVFAMEIFHEGLYTAMISRLEKKVSFDMDKPPRLLTDGEIEELRTGIEEVIYEYFPIMKEKE